MKPMKTELQNQAKLYDFKNDPMLGKSYCTCASPHFCVPGDISTSHCAYCGKPPLNELKQTK